jgi:hypothetical protein
MLCTMWCLLLSTALASEVLDDGAVMIRPGGEVVTAEAPGWTLLDTASTAEPISLDLVDADLLSVLRLIAEVGQINLVVGDGVSGRVTVRLTDVPWDQALAVILQSQGLAAAPVGEVVLVTPY